MKKIISLVLFLALMMFSGCGGSGSSSGTTVVVEDTTVIVEDTTVIVEDTTVIVEDTTVIVEDTTVYTKNIPTNQGDMIVSFNYTDIKNDSFYNELFEYSANPVCSIWEKNNPDNILYSDENPSEVLDLNENSNYMMVCERVYETSGNVFKGELEFTGKLGDAMQIAVPMSLNNITINQLAIDLSVNSWPDFVLLDEVDTSKMLSFPKCDPDLTTENHSCLPKVILGNVSIDIGSLYTNNQSIALKNWSDDIGDFVMEIFVLTPSNIYNALLADISLKDPVLTHPDGYILERLARGIEFYGNMVADIEICIQHRYKVEIYDSYLQTSDVYVLDPGQVIWIPADFEGNYQVTLLEGE